MRIGPRNRTQVPTRNSSDESEELRATLVEHLDELRTRIIRCVFLICGGWVVGWYIQPPIYEGLNQMFRRSMRMAGLPPELYKEVFHSVTDMFMLKLRFSFALGLIMTLPFVVIQIWGFIAPGLKTNEQKPLRKAAPFSVLLFALGCFFCWLIIPSAFSWFASYLTEFPGTALFQEPGTMTFFVIKMMAAFGVGFQLPLVVYSLVKIGIVGPETLMSYWRQATVVIFITSAVLTPSNDAFSMLMMAIPLSILFLLTVWVVKMTAKEMPLIDSTDDFDSDDQ